MTPPNSQYLLSNCRVAKKQNIVDARADVFDGPVHIVCHDYKDHPGGSSVLVPVVGHGPAEVLRVNVLQVVQLGQVLAIVGSP